MIKGGSVLTSSLINLYGPDSLSGDEYRVPLTKLAHEKGLS